METLQRVRQTVVESRPSTETVRGYVKSLFKALGYLALVAVLLAAVITISYFTGVHDGARKATQDAKVTSFHSWNIQVTTSPSDEPTPTSIPVASDATFPPTLAPVYQQPGVSPVVGSVTNLVTLSQAPTVRITLGADKATVSVTLDEAQWRELLAKSGNATLQASGLACLDTIEVCQAKLKPGFADFNMGPSTVGLSTATVRHLAEPYVNQLTAQQAAHIAWQVTVEMFTP